MLEIDESLLLDHLEAAVAASLLAESDERVGQFRFAHALINQTLYEGLGATRRRACTSVLRRRSRISTARTRAST